MNAKLPPSEIRDQIIAAQRAFDRMTSCDGSEVSIVNAQIQAEYELTKLTKIIYAYFREEGKHA